MPNPVFEICIDWDCADWAGVHDFTTLGDDISSDVKSIRVTRGKTTDDNVYPSATLEIVLNNASGNYYPTLATGSHFGKIRLWLPIRVRATYLTVVYNLFYGYINRITCSPLRTKQEAYFYATDGTDLLAKSILIQDMDDKTVMTDGEAIAEILNAAGWPAAKRSIDTDGGDIVNFPDTFEYTKPA